MAGSAVSSRGLPSTTKRNRSLMEPSSARDAEREASPLVAELDAVLLDLLDAEPTVDHIAFGVAAPIDEDHSLRRQIRVDQRLELEPGSLGGSRRSYRRGGGPPPPGRGRAGGRPPPAGGAGRGVWGLSARGG